MKTQRVKLTSRKIKRGSVVAGIGISRGEDYVEASMLVERVTRHDDETVTIKLSWTSAGGAEHRHSACFDANSDALLVVGES